MLDTGFCVIVLYISTMPLHGGFCRLQINKEILQSYEKKKKKIFELWLGLPLCVAPLAER